MKTLLTALLAFAVNVANAVTPLPPLAPNTAPTGYCYDTIFADGFDGVKVCPIVPAVGCPAVAHTPWGDKRLVTKANISYGIYPALRLNVDITTWDGMFGYNSTTGPVTPWPGVGGAAPVIANFPSDGYICAKFTTPTDMAKWHGGFLNPSYLRLASPSQTMAISKVGGDFSSALPTVGCIAKNVPASDANLVQWKGTTNAPSSWCNLQPNTTYYVNMMIGSTPGCSSSRCYIGAVSTHN